MWKSKVEVRSARYDNDREETACEMLRSVIEKLLENGSAKEVSQTVSSLNTQLNQCRGPVVKEQLVYLMLELIEGLPRWEFDWEHCLKVSLLMLRLVQQGVRDVIAMIKHRNNQPSLDFFLSQTQIPERHLRPYWCLGGLLLRYTIALVGSYHLFDFQTTIEEELSLLKLFAKEEYLLASLMKESHPTVKEAIELCQRTSLTLYQNAKLYVQEHIGTFGELSEGDFERFYYRYETFMTISKSLNSAKWFTGNVLEVNRTMNQQIEFRYRNQKDREDSHKQKKPNPIPTLTALAVANIIKTKLNCQRVISKLCPGNLEKFETEPSEIQLDI